MSSIDNNGSEFADEAEQAADMECSGDDRIATESCRATPSPELFHPPRLGIIHLLAWTGVTAVLMKIMTGAGWLGPMPSHLSVSFRIFLTANLVIRMAALAGGLVGTSVIVRAWYRGIGGRLQAGHWIVINTTVTSCLGLTIFLAISIIDDWLKTQSYRVSPSIHQIVFFSSMAAVQFVLAALWVVATIRAREPAYWKAAFVFFSVCSLGSGLMDLSVALFHKWASLYNLPIGVVLLLIIIPVVALIDLTRRMKRDWIHWLGVAIIMLTSVVKVMEFVALSFMKTP